MNDISATVVESPKDFAPEVLEGTEQSVDPLAIEEHVTKVTDTAAIVPAEKVENCDENAKEESVNDIQNGDNDNLALQTEKTEEQSLKGDTEVSISVTEGLIETPLSSDITSNVEVLNCEESEPIANEDNTAVKAETTEELIKDIYEEINSKSQSPTLEDKVVAQEEKLTASTELSLKVSKVEIQQSPLNKIIDNLQSELTKRVQKHTEPTKTIDTQNQLSKTEHKKVKIVENQINIDNKFKQTSKTSYCQLNHSRKSNSQESSPPVPQPSSKSSSPKVLSPESVSLKEIPRAPTPKAKEPSPPKEPSTLPLSVKPEVKTTDVDMTDITTAVPSPVQKLQQSIDKIETKESKPSISLPPVNGDVSKEEQALKRRASQEVDTESPLKKLCQEVEKTFPQHDTMINDYIQTATKNNIDEIQRHTEQLLAEIQTLRELAQKKEHEWNNILHLKKVKEEILLRLLRRKQVISFEKSAEVNGSDKTDSFDYFNQPKNLAIDKSDEISGLSIKQPGSTISPVNPMMQPLVMPVTSHYNPLAGLPPPYDKAAHLQNMPKPVYPQPMMMPGPLGIPGFPRDMNGQMPSNFGMPIGRQGPTKDVKSIIADYRQRNPEMAPRRGRRMKSILNPNMMNVPRPIAPKVDSMNNLNNLNMLFNNLDMNQKAMLERLQQFQTGGLPNSIFKDALVQFANMQQASAGLIPPNRPVETVTNRQEHHQKPEKRRPQPPEEPHSKGAPAPPSPRLPPPPYPEISLLPVAHAGGTDTHAHNSLLHGILTKAPIVSQSCTPSPTLAKLLTSPERRQNAALPTFGQAKNCGEITITPVQPTPPPDPPAEKTEEVVQLDDEESPASEGEAAGSPAGSACGSGSGRLVIDEAAADDAPDDAPLCQGCRRRDAQFVCAGCANQWYCSRDCQVAAWDEHSDMCSG